MALELKQISNLFSEIKEGRAALLLGQEYFKADDEYYSSVLTQLNIKNNAPSLNELWKQSPEVLGKALTSAAEHAVFRPWLRAILSLGWNITLSSMPDLLWVKNSVGSNFSLTLRTQDGITNSLDQFTYLNKHKPFYFSLFGDENSLPDRRQLLRLKNNAVLLNMIRDKILSLYGYFIVDGLADDDWFDISNLLVDIENIPAGYIYVFGANKKKIERLCGKNEDNWLLLKDYIDNGQIILCEMSLKDAIVELELDKTAQSALEEDTESSVRITLPNTDDAILIPRKDCTRLNKMGIILMRDELMTPFILTDSNKDKAFAEFIGQRDRKDWRFFDIIYDKKRMSFHISRSVEGNLKDAVSGQLSSSNSPNSIILLRGNSNSGKTTSLCWFAWNTAKNGIGKGRNSKNLVLYISGDPAGNDSDWQDVLVEFIKEQENSRETVNGDRIRNVIIVWDNYNSANKKEDYIKLYKRLNECNAVLIGSIYNFESVNIDSPVVQGTGFIELKPLNTKLEGNAQAELNRLLKIISGGDDWSGQFQSIDSENNYLFEKLIHFANYRYSPEWDKVRTVLKGGLYKEAMKTEGVSNELFNAFKDKNANDFNDVENTVLSLGIGYKTQAQFMNINPERQKDNVPLINAIRKMNLILAVASQFKKSIKLPLSILMRSISNGKQYVGDYKKLNKILRSDSMAERDNNQETGNIMISFRHPSEAIAYLDNNFGVDAKRKEKEIDVAKCLIENCRWDNYEEAQAVTAFVRSFGTNSLGKVNENYKVRGQYREYSEYWLQIVDHINCYASGNPEAMLVSGHFTRDYIETIGCDNPIEFLQNAFDRMKNAAEHCEYKSTRSRLYGEICRNLLEQMKRYKKADDENTVVELSYEFEDFFREAVKNGLESWQKNSYSLPMLLGIWLNYVINIYDFYDELLPDTLEYIDLLFYNESDQFDDGDDFVSIITNINRIFEKVDGRDVSDLRDILGKGNDSYAYFRVKQVLVKLQLNYKGKYPTLFDPLVANKENTDMENNTRVLSGRIFSLYEEAHKDFMNYRAPDNSVNTEDLFNEIKKDLKVAAGNIIELLKSEFDMPNDMTYRCLTMYIKAKWMLYTDNLLLEPDQYPALEDKQWLEMSELCQIAKVKDTDYIARYLNFIPSIYAYVFEKKKWEGRRREGEDPYRRICLCSPQKEDGKSIPRRFRVSVEEDERNNKLYAEIDAEIVNNERKKTAIVGQKRIYIPNNVRNYRDIKMNNINIKNDYMICFNLSGPQLKDFEQNKEV